MVPLVFLPLFVGNCLLLLFLVTFYVTSVQRQSRNCVVSASLLPTLAGPVGGRRAWLRGNRPEAPPWPVRGCSSAEGTS